MKTGVAFGLVILLAAVAAWAPRFLYPISDESLDQGPVVVLGGGSGERSARAIEVLPLPTAERPWVLSYPNEHDWGTLGRDCEDEFVHCIYPEPVSTWGEAQEVAQMAELGEWPAVTIVTSDFHLARSRLLFERCVDVPVALVGPGATERAPLDRAGYEAVAAAVSAAIYHDC